MFFSLNAKPLGPAAGVVAKKVTTAVVTGVSFAALDAGLGSISTKPQPEPTTPVSKVVSNAGPDIMIVIVCTTGASVFLVFIILLIISIIKVLNAKVNAGNNE